eukprot:415757-Rhodomonas_salina.2
MRRECFRRLIRDAALYFFIASTGGGNGKGRDRKQATRMNTCALNPEGNKGQQNNKGMAFRMVIVLILIVILRPTWSGLINQQRLISRSVWPVRVGQPARVDISRLDPRVRGSPGVPRAEYCPPE